MVFCTNCGVQLPDGSVFCSNCGTQLPSIEDDDMPKMSTAKTFTAVKTNPQGVEPPPGTDPDVICPYCHKLAGDLLDKVVGTQHYHLDCFNCSECGCFLPERFFRDPREKGLLLCPDCKPVVCGASVRTTRTGASIQKGPESGGGYVVRVPDMRPNHLTKCKRCGKTVYDNEKFRACESVWHRICFTCEGCAKRLDPSNYQSYHNNPYCNTCFSKLRK